MVLLYMSSVLKPSIVCSFILFILVTITVLWQVQFFNSTIVKWLIGVQNVLLCLPINRRDKSHPVGLREVGVNLYKLFIPNGLFVQLISQSSKMVLFVILGLRVFSSFWFTVLLLVQIFALLVSIKAFLVYRDSRNTNPTISYSKTFSVLAPFDAA